MIMAGGFGSHFWPLSKSNNPKQFIDVLGTGESLLQATFHRFEKICLRENIIIVTGEDYAEKVRQQIPNLLPYQVLLEPTRRNTAPCIAYAAAIINDLNPNANIIVTPSDHAVFSENLFVDNMVNAIDLVERHDWIVIMGVRPTNPNTKYGYIQFDEKLALPEVGNLHKVVTFTEKPPIEMARQFLASGEFFWNAGIFVWRLPVLMAAFRLHLPQIADAFFKISRSTPISDIDAVYSGCQTISIDFGIMEKADNVYVMESAFGWSDVETWDSLYSTARRDENNNAVVSGHVFSYGVSNCVVHVPEHKTVVLQGLDGYIVAGDNDTILVCRRDQEECVFKYASDVELSNLTK